MPPLRPITLTIRTDSTLAILAHLKEVKHLASERAIDLALQKYVDDL